MEYTPYLIHYGVKGMKWGVRRAYAEVPRERWPGKASNSKTSDADKEKRKATMKKVATAAAVGVTVAAAATIYAKNKDAIDGVINKYADKSINAIKNGKKEIASKRAASVVKKHLDNAAYANTHKDSILKSASKLNKYKDHYDAKTVEDAMKKIRTEQELHELSRKQIRNGADYVQAILTYGTVATTAYNMLKKPKKPDKKKK